MEVCAEMREGVGKRRMVVGIQGWAWLNAFRVKELDIVLTSQCWFVVLLGQSQGLGFDVWIRCRRMVGGVGVGLD
jgi:hypothetical protein